MLEGTARRRVRDSPKTKIVYTSCKLLKPSLNTVSTATTSPERNVSNESWPKAEHALSIFVNPTVGCPPEIGRKKHSFAIHCGLFPYTEPLNIKTSTPDTVRTKQTSPRTDWNMRPLLVAFVTHSQRTSGNRYQLAAQ